MELLFLHIRCGLVWLLEGGRGGVQARDASAQASFYLLNRGAMGGKRPAAAQRRQQARKSSIPSGEERWREMLSLAEMKSTEPRRRVISEAAAVEVPTAVPWITSKMLAESTAETRYSLMEEGICNRKAHRGLVSPSFSSLGELEGGHPHSHPAAAFAVPRPPCVRGSLSPGASA